MEEPVNCHALFSRLRRDGARILSVDLSAAVCRPNDSMRASAVARVSMRGQSTSLSPSSNCRAVQSMLGVSASAYYQRATGQRSDRAVEDQRLLERIEQLHAANYHAYGYRRRWKALLRRRAGRARPRQAADARGRDPGRSTAAANRGELSADVSLACSRCAPGDVAAADPTLEKLLGRRPVGAG